MQRSLVVALLLCSSAFAGLKPSGVDDCKLDKLEAEAQTHFTGKDIKAIYLQDSFESFVLKVFAPHYLDKKVLTGADLVVCQTLRKDDPVAWQKCLTPNLGPKERQLLQKMAKCLETQAKAPKKIK